MEQHSSNNATTAPRKVRFAPKARPRIVPKPAETKIEVTNDTDVNEATELMRRFNDGLMKRKPEVGRKYSLYTMYCPLQNLGFMEVHQLQ